MFLASLLAFCAVLSSYVAQSPIAILYRSISHRQHASTLLVDFIEAESPVAWEGILRNLGPDGRDAAGATSGVMVASPSKADPDYFYTWTRDSALTMKMLIDTFIAGEHSLQLTIERYIQAQEQLQTVSNPSGGLTDGAGLGEPKFNVDETAFRGPWGRPQRDGSALRVTALVAYSRWLLSRGQHTKVVSDIWPMIANDLAYVAQYWNETTYDLWEEVKGSSLFTTAVQYRALVEGNNLASQIGKSCPNCISQAPQILCFLQSFWNGNNTIANTNTNIDRTGMDTNTLLASLQIFDSIAGCDDITFEPCSPRALANHKAVVDSFRDIYAINPATTPGIAIAIGRYAEDTYQGGNPWYLTTLASAELLYSALTTYTRLGSITITPTSLPFFLDLLPSITPGTYHSPSPTFFTITSAIRSYADGFMAIVQKYTPPSGLMSEQFSQQDGSPLSASNLTWSYAAFLTAAARRKGQVPASWGNSTEHLLPATCVPSSAPGTYAPPCQTADRVAVRFEVSVTTEYGDGVYVVGSAPELGEWDADRAVELSAEGYSSERPVWWGTVVMAAKVEVGYKYFLKFGGENVRWEDGDNRVYNVPVGCTGKAVERDVWR